jgi:SPP1 gp7 family putative phage head morphogenesis protein
MKKTPKSLYPKLIEASYRQYLLGLVNEIKRTIRKIVFPVIDHVNIRQDAPPRNENWADEVDNTMHYLKISSASIVNEPNLRAHLISIGKKTNAWNDKEWRKVMHSVLSVDVFKKEAWLGSHLKAFVNTNTSLVTKLSTDTQHEVRRVIENGIRSGDTSRTIREALISETGLRGLNEVPWLNKVEARAQLIARDQIGKLNGELTNLRQTELGIETYYWRTMEDEVVRPEHAALDGMLCRWDDDSVYSDDDGKTWQGRTSEMFDGKPGEDYQCRCSAEANFTDEDFIAPELREAA